MIQVSEQLQNISLFVTEKAVKNWVVFDTAARTVIKHQYGYERKTVTNSVVLFPVKAFNTDVRTGIKHQFAYAIKAVKNE